MFLEHVLKEIVVTGKSLKLLDTIAGRKMNAGSRLQKNSMSLYQLYSESLVNVLRRADHYGGSNDDNDDDDDDDDDDGDDERSKLNEVDESENEDDMKDSFIDKLVWESIFKKYFE